MIHGSDAVIGDQFEVVSVNGEAILLQTDHEHLSNGIIHEVFADSDNLQLYTIGEGNDQEWSLQSQADQEVISAAMAIGPPAVEEENSSDNLPALGHLEAFQIQTAEDGSLLPSTVNAKMVDGTRKRITLFPEIVNGSVRYRVHFEDEVVTVDPPTKQDVSSISEKIDSIISQNENIITKPLKLQARSHQTKNAKDGLRIVKNQKVRPYVKEKRNGIFEPYVPRTNALYFPSKEALNASPSPEYLKIKQKFLNVPCSKENTEIPLELQQAKNFITLQKFLESQQLQLKIQPLENKGPPKQPIVNKRSLIRPHPAPAPTQTVSSNSEKKIFVKSSPEYFVKPDENHFPLGSTKNPIQLLQSGQTFHSRQPLSEAQLRQISSILQKQNAHINNTSETSVIYDPETHTQIVYRLVYPDNVQVGKDSGSDDQTGTKRKIKRSRNKTKVNSEEDIVSTESPQPEVNPPVTASKDEDAPEAPPAKVAKIPRTRSGRLSRPPRHMIRDYKRCQNEASLPAKSREEDWYMDYKAPDVETPAAEGNIFVNEVRPRARLRRNVKPEHQCPTCNKIYLGNRKMLLHLRKFPDHSNAEKYEALYLREDEPRKVRRINLMKIKQMLSGADRTTLQVTFGPFFAHAFNLWDFLLLRVSLLKRGGVEEIQAMLKELSLLVEKLGKIAVELLSPAFSREENDNVSYVDLQQEVAHALGLPTGMYKVNTDRMHLLRPQQEEPPPPQPDPPSPAKLATTFEPNLTTKLLECSNDSIDMECNSSKDVEPDEDKKLWTSQKDVTNSEFLSEFLQNLPVEPSTKPIPPAEAEAISLWKGDDAMEEPPPPPNPLASTIHEDFSVWKKDSNKSNIWKGDNHSTAKERTWKDGEPKTSGSMWKTKNPEAGEKAWSPHHVESVQPSIGSKHSGSKDDAWKEVKADNVHIQRSNSLERDPWSKRTIQKEVWEDSNADKETKKDWLKSWKEEAGGPGLRSARLTSTPESHGPALFSPPLRRNSVSSFAPSHQEELLSFDLHELFEDLIPDQSKQRRPKPNCIDSIINDALFTGNEQPVSHPVLAPNLNIIPDSLDEVANLDFLNHD